MSNLNKALRLPINHNVKDVLDKRMPSPIVVSENHHLCIHLPWKADKRGSGLKEVL